jgi:putative two-component system response regulator
LRDRPRILIVDDEKLNVDLMEAFLLPYGYEILKAYNGDDALDIIFEKQPDIVLLDIMMPGRNGFEITEIVKNSPETIDIPVLLVTALSDREARIKGMEAGADDFISKPIDKTLLITRVKSLLKIRAYNMLQKEYRQTLEKRVKALTKDLRDAYDKLKRAYQDTIYRLSLAAEYKDENTYNHIRRVGYMSWEIAKALGIDEHQQELILLTAPMHDIGKIGIPDEILFKPGKLTKDEFEIMKQHTIIGAKILGGTDVDYLKTGAIIALNHHEKFDGSGYPNGLKGKDIPIEGRIVAIVDVFDALTSKRPYKEAFPIDRSLQIIRESRGTHFDPEITDVFFDIKDDIIKIKENLKD